MNKGPLDEMMSFQLLAANRTVTRKFRGELVTHGVTAAQYDVLAAVMSNGELCQTDLCRILGVDRATMVALIDELTRRDLLIRRQHPHDRRRNVIEMTERGRRHYPEIAQSVRRQEAEIVASLDEDERERLIELLGRLTPT